MWNSSKRRRWYDNYLSLWIEIIKINYRNALRLSKPRNSWISLKSFIVLWLNLKLMGKNYNLSFNSFSFYLKFFTFFKYKLLLKFIRTILSLSLLFFCKLSTSFLNWIISAYWSSFSPKYINIVHFHLLPKAIINLLFLWYYWRFFTL